MGTGCTPESSVYSRYFWARSHRQQRYPERAVDRQSHPHRRCRHWAAGTTAAPNTPPMQQPQNGSTRAGTIEIMDPRLQDNAIDALQEDQRGRICFGTNHRGVARLRQSSGARRGVGR